MPLSNVEYQKMKKCENWFIYTKKEINETSLSEWKKRSEPVGIQEYITLVSADWQTNEYISSYRFYLQKPNPSNINSVNEDRFYGKLKEKTKV